MCYMQFTVKKVTNKTRTKKKIKTDPSTTVEGIASTVTTLRGGHLRSYGITELRKAEYYFPSLFFEKMEDTVNALFPGMTGQWSLI